MHKALLEAKVHTSWINHDEAYESAVAAFVDAVLDPKRSAAFLEDFARFQTRVARPGYWTSLAQLLLKLASEPTRVFTKDELLRDVWGFQSHGRTRTLDSHASRLRRRLCRPGHPTYVQNVWGVGYCLLGD